MEPQIPWQGRECLALVYIPYFFNLHLFLLPDFCCTHPMFLHLLLRQFSLKLPFSIPLDIAIPSACNILLSLLHLAKSHLSFKAQLLWCSLPPKVSMSLLLGLCNHYTLYKISIMAVKRLLSNNLCICPFSLIVNSSRRRLCFCHLHVCHPEHQNARHLVGVQYTFNE